MEDIQDITSMLDDFENHLWWFFSEANENEIGSKCYQHEKEKLVGKYRNFCTVAYPYSGEAQLSLDLLAAIKNSRAEIWDQLIEAAFKAPHHLAFAQSAVDVLHPYLGLQKRPLIEERNLETHHACVSKSFKFSVKKRRSTLDEVFNLDAENEEKYVVYLSNKLDVGKTATIPFAPLKFFQDIPHELFHLAQTEAIQKKLGQPLSDADRLKFRIDQISNIILFEPLQKILFGPENNLEWTSAYVSNPNERSATEFGLAVTDLIYFQRRMNPSARAEYVQTHLKPGVQLFGVNPQSTQPVVLTL